MTVGKNDINNAILDIACWPISFLGSSGLTGGQIDADGNITDVGIITMEMIEIGKNGYRRNRDGGGKG